MTEVEAYIRAGAIARGIDPDVAVRIAMTEGGVTDPYQMSKVPLKEGGTEQSVGPFQLLLNGGLGEEALKIGIDPTKDWKLGVDFALDTAAKKKSWVDWHGARDNGIPNDAGFTEATKPVGVTLTSRRHVGGAGSGSGNFVDPNVVTVPDTPPAVAEKELTWQEKLKQFVEGKEGKDGEKEGDGMAGLAAIAKGLSNRIDPEVAAAQMQITPSSIGMSDPSLVANSQALMSQLLQSRRNRYGMSLMG